MQILDVGESIPLWSVWYDDTGAGAEPSAITLTITAPDGTVTTYNKAQLTQGATTAEWFYDVVASQAGYWRYVFAGTLAPNTVTQGGGFLVGEASRPGASPFQPWCVWDDVAVTCPTVDLSGLDVGARERLLDIATDILWSLDGRRYPGIGEATRRVCMTCTSCVRSPCCCGTRSSIDLGTRWPVWGVWDVVIDGVTLDPSAYQLRDRRWLDRIDGESWPHCASLIDPDAFTISWAFGRRPPFMLADACAVFVAEMAKSCLGLSCELPSRVTNITREGVSYTILDSQKFLDSGKVGIYRVDLALAASKAGRKPLPGGSSPLPGQRTSRVG